LVFLFFFRNHTLREIVIEKFENLDEALIDSLKKSFLKWIPGLNILSIRITKPLIPGVL
jgi:erlin